MSTSLPSSLQCILLTKTSVHTDVPLVHKAYLRDMGPVNLVRNVHCHEQSQGVICDAYLHACDPMVP